MNTTKKSYLSPTLTVVTFQVEKGFATSSELPLSSMEDDAQTGEGFNTHSNWTSSDSKFWD